MVRFPSAWWRDPERAGRNLFALQARGGEPLLTALAQLLPGSPDPDRALNNLERYLAAAPDSLTRLLTPDMRGLETLIPLLGISQFFADILVADPDLFDMVRVPLRESPSLPELQQQLQQAVASATDEAAILRAFRRFRRQQMLRIGTNDIIHDRSLEEVTRDLSQVADACLQVAYATALRTLGQRFGIPVTAAGAPVRCVVLAFGKLGGEELNYSSDIDLMFVYDEEGAARGQTASEFFSRVVGEVVRLLSAHTDRGQAYRIDLRLRPEGRRGPLARSLESTLAYYDSLGRTWERQALIKLRPVAGDLDLGDEFLRSIEPFVYRNYLSFAEINEIKAMKRRIEAKALQAGVAETEVKTGRGGIRDIEFTVQFLQLLNGGGLPALRQRNTLQALQALATAGCVTAQEHQILDDGYRFLRRTEHRLQLLFDLQTHRLPETAVELQTLARRMGYRDRAPRPEDPLPRGPRSVLDDAPPQVILTRDLLIEPLDAFLHDHHEKTRLNRQILDHLVHSTFADAAEKGEPESDLILDPDPDEETIRAVLGKYRFLDVGAAYRHLSQLAQEEVPFLSTRRCRHFLASIAPALLRELARTPDPDRALLNLEQVTASLGAKAILWELFSFSPPSLKLTVDICAGSQFLTEILIHNPGMIDDLLDSLVLNRPRTLDELRQELGELLRGAADPDPILHSFQDKELLRIGVRDLLGKATIRETTLALSDVAEAILGHVTTLQEAALTRRSGTPRLESGAPARFVWLALGKLGGREMSYHSDLDLILIYEGDGQSDGPAPLVNSHWFTDLAQRVIKALSQAGPMGRLYKVDMRLRPTGRSGSLVTPLGEFCKYHQTAGQLWERQALTRARPVGEAATSPSSEFADLVLAAAHRAAYGAGWRLEDAAEIAAMRTRLEQSVGPRDVKRGPGGQVDIEFLVQRLLLQHGGALPGLRQANTWAALEALADAGLIEPVDHESLRANYDFLRLVESRLRLMTNRALDDVPENREELEKLARRLGFDSAERFQEELHRATRSTRARCKGPRGFAGFAPGC